MAARRSPTQTFPLIVAPLTVVLLIVTLIFLSPPSEPTKTVEAVVFALGLVSFSWIGGSMVRAVFARLRKGLPKSGLIAGYYLSVFASFLIAMYALIFKQMGVLDPTDHLVTDTADFLYFSIVTWTTLGYGDLKPTPGAARLFAASEALFGYVFMGLYLSVISTALTRPPQSRDGSKGTGT